MAGGDFVPAPSPDDKVKLQPDGEYPEEDDHDYPLVKLVTISAAWIGIQALWGTEFSVTSPYMEYVGMSKSVANLTWIWGPITGFIVAPIVGAASDRCESKWGRRRPFIIGGLLSMTVFAFLFGASGHIFGVKRGFTPYFALLMFIGMDATINVMQTPVRAIVSDLASSRQQSTGQLLSVGFQGLGGLCASAVMLPFAEEKQYKVFEVVAIALGINFALISLACFSAKEKVYTRPQFYAAPSFAEPFVTIFAAIRRMPVNLQRIAVVQFFSWFSLFCMWTFKSTWWAKVVYKGDPSEEAKLAEDPRYQDAQDGFATNDRIDLIANAVQIVLGVGLALAMEKGVLKSVKILYSGMLLAGGVLFYINYFGATGNPGVGKVTMSLIAIPICAINSFPFAILGADVRAQNDKELDTGVQFGILNWFIVIPQVIVVGVNSLLLDANQDDKLFLMVAISWTLAAIAALFIREPKLTA